MHLVADQDEEVRKAAIQVAAPLRGRELRPFSELLWALIASDSFAEALPQLLLTLQAAPDRIDDIALDCARRYIDVYGEQAGDISTAAAREAQEVIQLTLRAYAQAADRDRRRLVLDLVDDLLRIGAIGASDAVDQAERWRVLFICLFILMVCAVAWPGLPTKVCAQELARALDGLIVGVQIALRGRYGAVACNLLKDMHRHPR
jgi:hypothetical protein